MPHQTSHTPYELICVVVNTGLGNKVERIAKRNGIQGGTVFLGREIAHARLLDIFEISDIRKEVVIMLAEQPAVRDAVQAIVRELHLQRPNHGLAFTMPITMFIGSEGHEYYQPEGARSEENMMYHAIFTIVDKGKGEQVIDAAKAAGARGGTIINARGSGIHETSKVFNIEIEPEKEVVLVVAESSLSDAIVATIRERLEIDKPGNGILFVQAVSSIFGIVGKNQQT